MENPNVRQKHLNSESIVGVSDFQRKNPSIVDGEKFIFLRIAVTVEIGSCPNGAIAHTFDFFRKSHVSRGRVNGLKIRKSSSRENDANRDASDRIAIWIP